MSETLSAAFLRRYEVQ